LLPPAEALLGEDLVDPAPLDRQPLLLIEVGLQAVQRPAAERQLQGFRLGQRRGDDLGPLLGGVGRRPAGAGAFLEAGHTPIVEAADPGIGGGSRAAQRRGDGGRGTAFRCGLDDAGAFDQADRGGA
jgi:hypothetical protein